MSSYEDLKKSPETLPEEKEGLISFKTPHKVKQNYWEKRGFLDGFFVS